MERGIERERELVSRDGCAGDGGGEERVINDYRAPRVLPTNYIHPPHPPFFHPLIRPRNQTLIASPRAIKCGALYYSEDSREALDIAARAHESRVLSRRRYIYIYIYLRRRRRHMYTHACNLPSVSHSRTPARAFTYAGPCARQATVPGRVQGAVIRFR